MDVDPAIHGEVPKPLGVAKALHTVLQHKEKNGWAADLVVLGKQATDDDAVQMG
jgi:electron transfer flavoprotein alpha/beta subunit